MHKSVVPTESGREGWIPWSWLREQPDWSAGTKLQFCRSSHRALPPASFSLNVNSCPWLSYQMTEADVDSPGERSESLVLSQVRVRSTGLQPGEGYHEPRDSDSHVEKGLARDLSSFSVSELQEAFAFFWGC